MIIHSVEADKKTKEERVREFVKAMQAIEQAIKTFEAVDDTTAASVARQTLDDKERLRKEAAVVKAPTTFSIH